MKNEKWTKINVHFSKSQNTFEKTLHHSFSFGHYPFHQNLHTFIILFPFYHSKTSKPHASQSYSSGALCELMVADFAVFCIVTDHANKCANLHFGCVTIKMRRECLWSLSWLGNKIYIVGKHIFYIFYGTG